MLSASAASAAPSHENGVMRRSHDKRRQRWLGALALVAWFTGCGTDPTSQPTDTQPGLDTLHIRVPGFPPQPVPPDNPTTVQGVALGRRLFYDPILSGDSTQSCSSCHVQAAAFGDPNRFSLGIDGVLGPRHAPVLVNVGWGESLFWDGRAGTLEEQALEPVPNPIEMHQPWDGAVVKLRRHAEYPALFQAAFGTDEITSARAVQAIAQFERTLVSAETRYDQFVRDGTGLTASERRGYVLYFSERAECFHCHVDRVFTDQAFHNNGLDSVFVDTGRVEVTGDPNDLGRFKTPTLRNLVFSAPYMHDGRFASLEEVIDHYDSGGHGTDTVNPFILNLRRNHQEGHGLTPQDKQDLLAFLRTLTDSSFVTNPAFASPFR
jgi:cytochrome c peroxidase